MSRKTWLAIGAAARVWPRHTHPRKGDRSTPTPSMESPRERKISFTPPTPPQPRQRLEANENSFASHPARLTRRNTNQNPQARAQPKPPRQTPAADPIASQKFSATAVLYSGRRREHPPRQGRRQTPTTKHGPPTGEEDRPTPSESTPAAQQQTQAPTPRSRSESTTTTACRRRR